MAEEVLKTQDHVFCGRPQQCTGRGILYDCRDIGFCPYGERWRQLRRIAVVHLLNVKRVDSFRALREEEVASLVERIRAASAAGLEDGGAGKLLGVNVSELIVGLTCTVISRAAFGNKLGVVMEPGKVREMMEEVVQLLQTIAVSDVFPRLWWVDWAMGLDARTKRLASRLDDVFEEALREHEKSSGNDGEAAGDLLDDMLTVMEGGEGFHLDRVDVKGLIFDLFVGGTDNLQVDRVDNGRARQEPKRNGESASRGETCCWGTRRSARGAAGSDEPTASGHERSHAVTSNGAAAGPL